MKEHPMSLFAVAADVPVPHDLPLPLPVSRAVLQLLIVLFFLLHILFVNLMVGGSLMTFCFELMGLRDKRFDRLALLTAKTVTVNKSMAVVLGVGPLLAMNLLYTTYFYTANALTGLAWVMVIPLTVTAFLLTYAHKYSWERLAGNKVMHLTMGFMAVLLFLSIPLIFLANANLMLYPERWREVKGFFSSLLIPNVLPRYLHFLLACVAVTNLFLSWWLTRVPVAGEPGDPALPAATIRRTCYSFALVTTALQFLAGPLLYFTLPAAGVTGRVTGVVLIGVVAGAYTLSLMVRELLSDDRQIGRLYRRVVFFMAVAVLCMGTGRHFFREDVLHKHRLLAEARTLEFQKQSAAARKLGPLKEAGGGSQGESVYKTVCIACHQPTGQGLPGAFPPLAGSEWVLAKAPDHLIRIVLHGLEGAVTVKGVTYNAAPMPGQKEALSDEQIAAVLTYIRQSWGNDAGEVTVERVRELRAQYPARNKAWNQGELQSIPLP